MRLTSVILGLCCAAGAHAAPGKPTLDVLGIHHGDLTTAAEATLKSNGFRFDRTTMLGQDCSRSYDEMISSRVAGNDRGNISCSIVWSDAANRQIRVTSVISPQGYRVSYLNYKMPVAGGAAVVAPALAKKFGPGVAKGGAMGKFLMFTGAEPNVSLILSDEFSESNVASISLTPRDQFADQEAAKSAIAAAVAQRKTGGKLKL